MPHHEHLMIARVETEHAQHAAPGHREANDPGRNHDDRATEPGAPFRETDCSLRHIEVPGGVASIGDDDHGPGAFAHHTLIWSLTVRVVVIPWAAMRSV